MDETTQKFAKKLLAAFTWSGS